MGSIRIGAVAGALLLILGCGASSPGGGDAGLELDAGVDAGTDAGTDAGPQPDGGDGGALSCADFGFVASGAPCGSSCASVSCSCPEAFPRSLAACTADGCLVAMDCAAVCGAPSLGDAMACTDTYTVFDAGTDAGTDAGLDAGVDPPVAFGCFGPPTQLADAGGFQIAAADVNGDEQLDLVTSYSSPGGVKVWLNAGGGTFTGGVRYDVGLNASAIQVADLTQDGRPDLVLNSQGSLDLGVNDGDGGFAPGFSFDAGWKAGWVGMGDLDQDGRLDLAVPQYFGVPELTLLWSQADGGFVPSTQGEPFSVEGVGVGDLNEDGWPDLVVGGTSQYAVALNQQDAGFASTGSVSTPWGGYTVTFADFDLDGHQDVALGEKVWRGDGGGGLAFWADVPYPQRPTAADLDGDGRVDLAYPGNDTLEIALQLPDGGFALREGPADAHATFALGDFDGDGRVDLAMLDSNEETLSLYPNTCGPGTPPACAPLGAPCATQAQCCSNACGGGACL